MTLGYYKSVFKTLGLLIMVFSLSIVLPFMVSAFEGDTYTASSFMAAFFFTLIVGIALWLPTRKDRSEIRLHEGFLIVASSPLTRSSYHADEDFSKMKKLREKQSQCHPLQ